MKHTPGPWYASSGDQPQIASESTNDGRTLCLVYEVRDETQSNAKLIAASPELLEALQAIEGVDDPDKAITASWTVEDWRNAKRQYNEVARKAIAKALGTGPA